MKNIHLPFSLLIVSVFVWQLFITSAHAQWSTNPNVNNVICDATLDQLSPKIISDGSGGAIITWDDNRNSNTNANIYVQRIDAAGVVQWTLNGATICDTTRNQNSPTIASDGSGGAIIAWADFRDVSQLYQIYAQRINSSGVVQWTTNGVRICNITDGQYTPTILSDGSGGAIITWHDFRGIVAQTNIYAQKINSSGEVLWAENGVAICNATGEESHLTMVSDGFGGAIITWEGWRQVPSETNIYAQKIDSAGVMHWLVNGVVICDTTSSVLPTSASDGAGGAIITWMDFRNGSANHIYAQKIDSTGNVQWTVNGVAICTAQYGGSHPTIVSDGSGGAIITWEDLREGALNFDIYAQKIDSAGVVQWTVDGVAVCTAAGNQVVPTIESDDEGGGIITWQDKRGGSSFSDIYAQKINSSGVVQWTANGVAISTATGNQSNPTIESDGSGGAIITWGDYRGGSYSDIYAQQVNANGLLGVVSGISGEPGVTMDFALLQNYPNPFNPTTKIRYSVPQSSNVIIKMFDILGNEIETLVNEEKPVGSYEIEFNAVGLSSGIYFYKLQAGSFIQTKKMILLK